MPVRIPLNLLMLLPISLAAGLGCGSESTVGEDWVAPSWLQGAEIEGIPASSLEACATLGSARVRYESDELSRVAEAQILSNGRIAVAEGMTESVLIFDGTGLEAVFGGRGEGPGEFKSLNGLARVADTLLAWDVSSRRVTALTTGGELLWTKQLTPDYPAHWGVEFDGRTSDGRFPFLASGGFGTSSGEGVRDTVTVVSLGAGQGEVTEGVRVPSQFHATFKEGRGWRTLPLIFSPQAYLTVSAGSAWVGESSSGVVVRLDETGFLAEGIRLDLPRTSVSADLIEGERRALRSLGPGKTSVGSSDIAAEIKAFESLPVFQRLQGTAEGHLWISEFTPRDAESRRHWVLDSAGKYLGCALTNSRWRIMDSRAGQILVLARDSLDIPFLELYEAPNDWGAAS